MKILALDTATEALSAALLVEGQLLEHYELAGRTHSERLSAAIHRLMGEAELGFSQLDALVCGVGPGSFVGVRLGLGYAKGLALALDLPVVPVSSLAMLAQRAIDDGARDVLACIDARTGEVYLGGYAVDASGLAVPAIEACCARPAELPVIGARPWTGVGSGWAAHRTLIEARCGIVLADCRPQAVPLASSALKLALPVLQRGAAISADQLVPSYLRDRVALTIMEQARARAANRG